MQNIVSQASSVPKVGIGAWIIKDGKVLMGQRKGAHGQNQWAPPGGHLEFKESPFEAAKRELKEETDLDAEKLEFATWTNDIYEGENKHYISIHMVITQFSGEIKNLEPKKCLGWKWVSVEGLDGPIFLSAKNFFETEAFKKRLTASKEFANI